MKPNLLKAERELRGWSQSRIAELLGTTTKTVGRWERGEAVPYPHYREQLCTLFGKNAQQLGWLPDADEKTTEMQDAAEEAMQRQDLEEIATESLPATLTEPWLLVDPAIPQVSGKANRLLGHRDLFTQVKQHLFTTSNQTSMALEGLPGSGKTTLAVAIATDRQVQAHFCDGILWAAPGSHSNVLSQLIRWGKLLGVTLSQVENVKSLQAWTQALRAAIGTRRLLLIIDDAWTVEDALALQIGGPACTHLLTTHRSQVAHVFAPQESIVVPPLEEADGLALLARFVPQLVQQDPEGAQALVQAMDRLPLALTLIGNYLAAQTFTNQPQPLQVTLKQIHEIQQHLGASTPSVPSDQPLRLVETIPLSLHAAIAICDQHLSLQAHATLCALSIFASKPESFSKEAALTVSHQSVETLDELLKTGLLENWDAERYILHQTIADYARTQREVLAAEQQSRFLVEAIQVPQQGPLPSPDSLFPPQSLPGVSAGHTSSASRFQPALLSSWLPLFTLSTILLASLATIALLLAFNKLPLSSIGQVMNNAIAQFPPVTSYQAAAPENTLTGGARVIKCSFCSGKTRVNDLGLQKDKVHRGTLQFNNVSEGIPGDHTLTIYYINGYKDRILYMNVNGEPAIVLYAPKMKNWNTVGTINIKIYLHAGYNTIEFSNPFAHAPDIDRIVVK